VNIFGIILVVFVSTLTTLGQTASNDPMPGTGRTRPDDESEIVKNMLAKQQTAREKKEYAELIARSEEALKLSEQIEAAFVKNEELSDTERKKLESFEKLVAKIRNDLGGDDKGEVAVVPEEEDKARPKDVREGFLYLKCSTEKLVSEIKRSTRFSVSIVAIESSNTLIRLARFLRLKN
jgi:hypothetical protein